MRGAAAPIAGSTRAPRRMRAGYKRVAVYVPRVLWDAVKVEAERQHRTPSAEAICALEQWLGWDGDGS